MIQILIAGDFVPRDRVAKQIDSGDFSCLKTIEPYLRRVDYSIVNFESPAVVRESLPVVKTGPSLKCTKKAMECIVKNGFKCVTLANNHFRDYGKVGVEDTISLCEQFGVDYVGGGRNIEEAERTLYKTFGNQRLAIINVCENEWSIAGERIGGSNPLNPVRNFQAIKEARKKANYVVVIVHGGVEMYQYPTPRMIDTYRFFIDAGADAVVNHHQHCFSGYELWNGKPIFYGLGNFCFDRNGERNSIWNEGYIVNLQFDASDVRYKIIPYIQCNNNPSIVFIEGLNKELFDKRLKDICDTITNPKSLRKEFDLLLYRVGKERLLNMEPFSNKYIRALQRRRLFPRLIKGKVLYGWLSRLRCESHLEILIALLTQRLSKEK